MTEEQRAILEKFGFSLEDGKVKHSKLGIVREIEDFMSFSTARELQEFVKEILRNQCQLKRKKP
ncbi:hypothetical protein BRE01_42460 [Brevibacillus reuszeri]|uniref:Uncharacterized protein n=1 Tax=Brevibacillus reuszeri TaxID=54915 RepID=A0A0K9YUM7_9BACL|nr:hypothetical protein [Brevibacillus reuszeri]KNB72396.1 hypothetical protein ADS79_11000 [Brevibacillus reuszeri]MED1860941.1 hypothetical protein [Brevibacillus reuszeri]GED70544.1 hypothetical protein BRE01_42460 [Brevibacillus reuszeri]